MSRARVAILGALISAAVSANSADAFTDACWFDDVWTPQTIEVFVNIAPESSPGAHCIQGEPGIISPEVLGYDIWEFTRALQMATARWNEAGSMVRLKYVGTTMSGCINGAIVVGVAKDSCSGLTAFADSFDLNGDDTFDAGVLAFHHKFNLNGCSEVQGTNNYLGTFALLTHELGHNFGRIDTNGACPNTNTVMGSADSAGHLRGLTSFDKAEHVSRMGAHQGGTSGGTSLARRTLATIWGPTTTQSLTVPTIGGPGLGASYVHTSLRVPLLEDPGTAGGADEKERTIEFTHGETWGASWYGPAFPAIRNPVAIAIAPNGSAIQAHIWQSNPSSTDWQICYQKSTDSGATFGAWTCYTNPPCSGSRQNNLGATYDPLSGRFLISWGCVYNAYGTYYSQGTIGVLSVPRPGAPGSDFWASTFGDALDGASIACADTQPIDAPLYSNCRVAWVSGQYPSPVKWMNVGSDNQFIYFGNTYTAPFTTEHTPAVAWHNNRFHVAYSTDDTQIYNRSLSRTGTLWSALTQLTEPNSSGWVSPPMLSPTKSGTSRKLHAFWVGYQVLPM